MVNIHKILLYKKDIMSYLKKLKLISIFILTSLIFASTANAKYASFVINENTKRIYHNTNADTRNYPASLTKIMTLYMIFDALKSKKLSMNTKFKVSKRATRQPPSKLNLAAGSKITVKNAILALITKSANDVATVVAENLGKSERNFAKLMTKKAKKLGMNRTIFKNASGLPNRGQLSTARDMATLGMAIRKNHPNLFKLFKTKSFVYKGIKYTNHNNLLGSYSGTDGIKTGYTNASGFNLVASVERNGQRIIGVVFGGEASGLTNDHLSLITKCVTIDTHENFSSLNLSHAVNVFCYSLFSQVFKTEQLVDKNSEPHGSQNDLIYFFDHLEEELESRGFFQPEEKMSKMKQNLRNIFHRADLSEREIATLRGVVTVLTEYRKTKEI